jgi:hypothetical protein
MAISIVGVDLSKSVFQLSIADSKHHVVDRKRLSRAQFHRFLAQTGPVRLVMEACGTCPWRNANSSCYWLLKQSAAMLFPAILTDIGDLVFNRYMPN